MSVERHIVKYGTTELPNPVGSYRLIRNLTTKTFTFEQDFIVDAPGDGEQTKDTSAYVDRLNEIESQIQVANQALVVSWLDEKEKHRFDPEDGTARRTRATIVRAGTPFDLSASAQLTLRVTGDLPADDFHGETTQRGWTEAQIAESLDPRNQPMVTFDIEYRFTNAGDAISLALDETHGAEAFAKAWFDANYGEDASENFALISRQFPVDDDHSVLRARLTYRFEFVPAVSDGTKLSDKHVVDDVSITPMLSSDWGGPPGDTDDPPYPLQVTATVRIDGMQTDWATLKGYYEQTIRPLVEYHVKQVIESEGPTPGTQGASSGRTRYVLLDESYPIRISSSVISVSWVVQLADSWLRWSSTKRWLIDERLAARKLADGRDHTYDLQTMGRREDYSESIEGLYASGGSSELSREELLILVPPVPSGYETRITMLQMQSRLSREFGGKSPIRLHRVELRRESIRSRRTGTQSTPAAEDEPPQDSQ